MKLRDPQNIRRRPARQHGVMTLVVAVVILIALTLVTLYTASPVRTEQQVTANERRSLQALNAAEAGLAWAMAAIHSYDHDVFLDLAEGEEYPLDLCEPKELEDGGSFMITHVAGQPCADGWPPFGNHEPVLGYRSIAVVSVGRSDDDVAMRRLGQTYFLIDPRDPNPAPLGTVPPLNFAGPVEFEAPNSDSFEVDGIGGPAMGLASQDDRAHVLQAITDVGRADNYKGPISGDGFAEPFDTADSLREFINTIYEYGSYTERQGDQSIAGNTQWDGINVVKGDMEFKGTSGGSGVLIVEGNLKTSGTPPFAGLIIVLGGEYHVGGGGKGGLSGAIFVANLDLDGDADFGDTEFKSDGGGNALFTASAEDLRNACNLLPAQAQALWNCDDVAIGVVDDDDIEPFAPVTGVLSGSWIDY